MKNAETEAGSGSPEKANEQDGGGEEGKSTKRREIQGNLPYSTSAGVFENILEAIQKAERPPVFSADFMKSVLGFSGGSARSAPPLMKKLGLLDSGGHPTPLYADFQAEYSRPNAALIALKNGFSEIFKRNAYAHKATENEIKDIVVQITGLRKDDNIVKLIARTFEIIRSYAKDAVKDKSEDETAEESEKESPRAENHLRRPPEIGLSYQINIVLPPTDNVEVFNAIFKSLRENLLK